MDYAFIALGVVFVTWGIAALWATWLRPDLVARPLIRTILLPGRVAPARSVRTLASSIPIMFGIYFIVSSLSLSGPQWPSLVLMVVLFIASVALQLQRSDG